MQVTTCAKGSRPATTTEDRRHIVVGDKRVCRTYPRHSAPCGQSESGRLTLTEPSSIYCRESIFLNGATRHRVLAGSVTWEGRTTRRELSCGSCRAIALSCATEHDLENICRQFYDGFERRDTCSHVARYQAPCLQVTLMPSKELPVPKPCRIYAVNGGRALPLNWEESKTCQTHRCDYALPSSGGSGKVSRRLGYYYDFAIVGECEDVECCLRAFLKRTGLQEVESVRSLMSTDELRSLMGQWRRDAYRSGDEEGET